MAIILIGFMGSGKTTIGSLLAKQLNWPFIDLDQEITKQIAMSIDQYFSEFGEANFRRLESEVLQENLGKEAVIATGGGIISDQKNRELLKIQKNVILLQADFEVLKQRITADKENIRPLAKEEHSLFNLFNARKDLYLEVADQVIETAQKTPSQIASKVKERINLR